MKSQASIIGIVLATSIAGAAYAGPRDFIVEHAGEGGDAQTAQPYIDAFLRYIEQAAGWPAKSATGRFAATPAEAYEAVKQLGPGYGLFDPDVWLQLSETHAMQVVGTVVGDHAAAAHYVIVSKDAKTLDDLAGKKVESNHPLSKRYLTNIVGCSCDFTLDEQASMIKSIKHASRGEAAGALVTDEEWKSQQAAYGATLHVVWTSTNKLPPTPVVAFTKVAPMKDREAFTKALMAMCTDAKGAPVCKQLGIEKFTPPDKSAYDEALRRYKK